LIAVGLPEDRAVEQAPEESIAVVEPRAVARAGLLRMLRRADFRSTRGFESLVRIPTGEAGPGVVVLSLELEEVGVQLSAFRSAAPKSRVLGLAYGRMCSEPVLALLPLLDGLVQTVTPEHLRVAIGCIRGGHHYFEGGVPADVWRRMAPGTRPPLLSDRERQVLRLLGEGLKDAELAARLGCSVARAKALVRAVLRKTGSRNRAQAATVGVREGWVG
jgi:DNA-binding NarL/FixJ family response regulator